VARTASARIPLGGFLWTVRATREMEVRNWKHEMTRKG
jgi:hypothetical protein